MSEIKTFGELCLQDRIFYVTDKKHSSIAILKIECDPDDYNRTLIELHDTDSVSFPDDETVYEDKEGEVKYTTDKKQYHQWTIPFIEKQIAYKEKILAEIQLEIQELKESITPGS